MFRLDRVLEASLREDRFTRPPDFDALAFVIHSVATLPSELVLDVLVKTDLEHARQWIAPGVGTLEAVEGGVALRGYVQDVDWVARYLSGLHCSFVVLQPPELKAAIRQHAEALAAATR
jgi:predicted DNA-binding transcriptional regulator YafY